MKHPRFTLRTLLIATVCIALLVAWLVVPTFRAEQFKEAILRGDANLAKAMLDSSIGVEHAHRQLIGAVINSPLRVVSQTQTRAMDVILGRRRILLRSATTGAYQVYLVSMTTILSGGDYIWSSDVLLRETYTRGPDTNAPESSGSGQGGVI